MYHKCFPHKSITPKMHEYIFNVPKFVARHRTLGLCSEEEGESLHAAFNLEIRAVTSVRDPAEQMRILQERQEMRCHADKSLITPSQRVCRKCQQGNGAKSFFRSPVGGNGPKACCRCGNIKV